MMKFQALQLEIAQWSKQTFTQERADRELAIARHLIEEAQELFDAVCRKQSDFAPMGSMYEVKGQMADCFILLMDLAERYGLNMTEIHAAIESKMEVNRKRTWEMDDNGLYHHVEDEKV